MFVPLAALGVYNAALTAYSVLVGMSGAVNNALLPVYSGISSRGNDRFESCRHATLVASRYVSLAIVPLAFGLLATAKPALTLFVGQAYADGTIPLMILTCVFGLTLFGSALGPMLLALSETRVVSGIAVMSVLVGLASAAFLLPFLGITGASVARGVALIISTALTLVVLARKKAMRLDTEVIWKSLVAAGLMSGVLFGMQAIIYSRLLLPIYIVVGCLVYLLALRFLRAVRKEDVDLIARYLGKRLRFTSRLLSMIVLSDNVTKSQ
jgi:O-antigen/teichoic acid export membrane protein